jgi:di/tricarboxylate transporter
MTIEQILAFSVIAGMMVAFIIDKFRYDVVACSALLIAVALGVVPFDKAFSGFSDDIVIIVASALIVSTSVARSGIVDTTIKKYFPEMRSKHLQLAFLMIVVAVMSAFIKNIGALAMLMPAAFQMAKKNNTSPSVFLMPMATASLLGGLMTLVGTSPNIIVSRVREDMTGEPFRMFDYFPTGFGLLVVGLSTRTLVQHFSA